MLVIMLLRIVLFAPMMGIGALYKALTHSTSMTWIIFMILIVISVVLFILIKVVMPKFKVIELNNEREFNRSSCYSSIW